MKKVLFLTMILALTASVASAGLIGVWISDTVSGKSRYTLQVTSDVGTMTGFDIMLQGANFNQPGGVFSTATNDDTHFLFQKSHVVPPLVTDLAVGVEYEDTENLMGAFTATAGGIYAAGFTNPVNVLQVVTADPANPFSWEALATDGVKLPQARIGTGTGARLEDVHIVPEPSTVVLLLALGLAGLVVWRRR